LHAPPQQTWPTGQVRHFPPQQTSPALQVETQVLAGPQVWHWPASQAPQLRVPPQPSGTLPQVLPSSAQVFGVQQAPAWQTWPLAQLVTQVLSAAQIRHCPAGHSPQSRGPQRVATVPHAAPSWAQVRQPHFPSAQFSPQQSEFWAQAVPGPPQAHTPPTQAPLQQSAAPAQVPPGGSLQVPPQQASPPQHGAAGEQAAPRGPQGGAVVVVVVVGGGVVVVVAGTQAPSWQTWPTAAQGWQTWSDPQARQARPQSASVQQPPG